MWDTNVGLDGAGAVPAEVFEERDVARLDVGGHERAAEAARGRDGEPNQRHAETEASMGDEYGEAITLPVLSCLVERKQPHRAGRFEIPVCNDLERGCKRVVLVTVISAKQALFADEYFHPDEVVLSNPVGVGHYPATGRRNGHPGGLAVGLQTHGLAANLQSLFYCSHR